MLACLLLLVLASAVACADAAEDGRLAFHAIEDWWSGPGSIKKANLFRSLQK
jgi:hypothetical protein